LFGRYATGNNHDWSDIDLALVSDAFGGERFCDRNKIRRIKLEISCDLKPLPYRPQGLTTDYPLFKKLLKLECGLSDRQRIIALKTMSFGSWWKK